MKRKFEITDASGGAAFSVRVVTRTSRTEIAAIQDDGIIKVRLTESHEGNAANEQLINFLAQVLEVEPTKIEIVAGANVRDKLISVDGITPDYLEEKVNASIAANADEE